MKFLRTVSTRRLLAMVAVLVAAIAGGTAIAVAATNTTPVPRPLPLARAIHNALAAPQVGALSARISFTNHLIDSSDLQGASNPILTGASGRLWLAGNQLRLELQGDNGDAQVVVNNRSFWVYDPSSNTVYEGTLPAQTGAQHKPAGGGAGNALPTVAQIQSELNQLMQHLDVSGARPSDVAGRAAYTVRVSPKHSGGLLGDVQLAWDALRGVPLRIAVYARGDSTPVLELKATSISYGAVSASEFALRPPPGAKVVQISAARSGASSAGSAPTSGANSAGSARSKSRTGRQAAAVTGVAAVAHHLSFPLVAPAKLVGLPRQSVTLLDWGGSPAALVTYGQNLGGIAVIEQTASSAGSSSHGAPSGGGSSSGLTLPTVSINGATGQELDTALGTVVRFTRAGVSYTVLGSVPPTAADAAARAL